ncbi:hypothetical protein K388_06855 [Streptomyces sp. KhCrAH-43]|uniref:hypothetical protein n=1 Tax=unclassified Streptomyces TaxID=2593676 RepID=UPI0003610302|nr:MULTISPECIES: hypothetical protein [unclassified Streptomyces]MYS39608.1 hypothetical protein [Streptomyces sp. SID4920]MYX70503.1 hypothetical protein [Streptomyces sp. SID8373]RAJ48880.1 hypothetical protein K388_06855 [Streptomyces sp. KhCrAH-43]
MEPVLVIASALAAGAGVGARDVASAAVQDAYAALRDSVRRRFSGRREAEEALAGHEEDPETWQDRLTACLAEAGAAEDAELLAAAEDVLRLAGREPGRADGRTAIDLRSAKGVQVGDGNVQHNAF